MKKITKKSAAITTPSAPTAAGQSAAPVTAARKPAIAAKPVAPLTALSRAVAPVTAAHTATTSPSVPTAKPVSAKPATATTTTIEAKIDVGFGNQLYVRGQGEGLSWDHGIPLENVDSRTWRLVVPAKNKFQIKLLINDSIWAKGEDVVVTPGKRVELVPAF